MKNLIDFIGIGTLVLWSVTQQPVYGQQPSFDCLKASSVPEKLICSDPDLASLDKYLAEAYKAQLNLRQGNEQQVGELRTSQKDWLRNVRSGCGDVACLNEAYSSRLDALVAHGSASPEEKAKKEEEPKKKAEEKKKRAEEEARKKEAKKRAAPAQEAGASAAALENVVSHLELKSPAGIIAFALLLAVIFLAYTVVRKTLRGIKRLKYRNKVEKTYANINAIGKYADSNQHIVAFSAKRRLSSDVTIDVLNCYLEVSYPNTTSNAKWSASIGYVNKASYAQAMSSYQIAYTQYSIAKSQHEAAERKYEVEQRQRGNVQSYGSFKASAPSKPSKSDHVDWYIEKGDCSAAIRHNRMISSKASALLTEKLGSFEVNFEKVEAGFFSIYKNLIKRIDSGDVKVTKQKNIIVVTPLTDAELQSTFQSEISAKCLSDAKSRMGGYHESESIVSCDTRITRNAHIFPITIVFTQAGSGKKPSYVFHDAQFPEIEIS